jgi:hypothetical protein
MLRYNGSDMVDLRGSCDVELSKFGVSWQIVCDLCGIALLVKVGAIVSKRLSPSNVPVNACAAGRIATMTQ